MMQSDMRWSATIRNACATVQDSAASAPAQGLWAGIARMVAVGGICAIVLFGLGTGADAGAEKARSARYSEYLVKTAFLYSLAKFTEWPASAFPDPAAPLQLCVLGDNPFGAALRALDGRTVNVRPLATRHVRDVRDLNGCHVVFLSATGSNRLFQDLGRVESRPLLTVGDSPGFARAGGVIGLKIVDDRLKFEINVTAARIKGLWFDVRLLRLADIVYIANARSR